MSFQPAAAAFPFESAYPVPFASASFCAAPPRTPGIAAFAHLTSISFFALLP